MKRLAILASLGFAASAFADVYTDSVGDFGANIGSHPHIDITSVEVTNDATSITFKFNLNGDPVATDWGKYCVIIDSVAGGDTTGNGWVRPFGQPSGADYWLGGWADSGNGMENRGWDGSAWQLLGATYNSTAGMSVSKDSSSYSMTLLLADLGLSVGDTILFDAITTGGGGGDGAVDSAGNPNAQIENWGDYSTANNLSYTVVPEPGTMIVLGAGAAALLRRRRK